MLYNDLSIDYRALILWMWLLAGTIPAFKKLLAGTIPAFKRLLAGTHKFYFFGVYNTFTKKNSPLKNLWVPAFKRLLAGTHKLFFFGFLTLFTKKNYS